MEFEIKQVSSDLLIKYIKKNTPYSTKKYKLKRKQGFEKFLLDDVECIYHFQLIPNDCNKLVPVAFYFIIPSIKHIFYPEKYFTIRLTKEIDQELFFSQKNYYIIQSLTVLKKELEWWEICYNDTKIDNLKYTFDLPWIFQPPKILRKIKLNKIYNLNDSRY